MGKSNKHIKITPDSLSISTSVGNVTLWSANNFAEDWFHDALNEARTGKDYHARRREIIFATCFAESYIFEWTRGKAPMEELNDYFPPKPRFEKDPQHYRGLKEKWKEIPKELYNAKKITKNPNLNISGLGTLLNYRNGLIHAKASRPETNSQPQKAKPFPTKNMLKKVKPGWATRIVVELVVTLHNAVGESIPDYIENP